MSRTDVEAAIAAAPGRDRPAQPALLRRGGAGDQRPRVRPADGAAHGARGRAPRADHSGQPDPARRRRAARRVRDGHPRRPDALDRQHLQLRRGPRVGRAGPQGAQPGRAGPVRRRAEGGRRGRLAPLRGGPVRPGGDARRRRARRRHHGQPPDRPGHPAGPRRRAPAPARGPGRGLHDQLRARPAQRAAPRARGDAVRQPPQLDGRLAQAARPEALRPAPAPVRLARAGRVPGDRRRRRTARSSGS